MKNIIKIIILMITLPHYAYSQQNYLYIGEKKYPSTVTWNFDCKSCRDNMFEKTTLGVSVVKTSTGGYLQLSISSNGSMDIGGIAMLYLEDGTAIKCSDKGMKDNVDGKSIAIYVLTMPEILRLKSSNIEKVRFNTNSGGFTAESTSILDETAEAIKVLFDNPK